MMLELDKALLKTSPNPIVFSSLRQSQFSLFLMPNLSHCTPLLLHLPSLGIDYLVKDVLDTCFLTVCGLVTASEGSKDKISA